MIVKLNLKYTLAIKMKKRLNVEHLYDRYEIQKGIQKITWQISQWGSGKQSSSTGSITNYLYPIQES